MNEKIFKDMREQMNVSEDAIIKLQQEIANTNTTKRKEKIKSWKYAVATAASILLALCLYNKEDILSYAKTLVASFTITFTTENKDVEMKGEYIKVSENACKEDRKYSSIQEVEKTLGLSILKSPNAYEQVKNTIEYIPYVSKSDELNGAMLINSFYLVGDLKNVKPKTFKKFGNGNSISYNSGEIYQSPIMCQITIRTDKNLSADYDNRELDYAGGNWDLQESEQVSQIEVYECKSLGIKAILYTVKSDGPNDWRNRDNLQSEEQKNTVAQFIYKNVEYIYLGGVSRETMKEIIEGLTF